MDAYGKLLAAGIVFALSAPTTAGETSANIPPPPPPPVPVDAFEDDWAESEAETFDVIRAAPSARTQVLAADIYLEEAHRPLRPKPDDVVARAAKLAPDDPFVQWTAARDGRYQPSSCGPAAYPIDEISNLLRLEPDNAAAWTFAVALAAATGDEDGVDSALSHMAISVRADDHFIEHWQAWDALYAAHPELRHDAFEATPESRRARMESFVKARGGTGEAASVMQRACTSDSGERTWQRLGWCADAARVLAREGGSVDLRSEGLRLLEAIGDRSEQTGRLRRENQWWTERRSDLFTTGSGTAGPDLKAASTQIEAIEQILVRDGKPTAAPAGWESQDEIDGRRAAAAQAASLAYQRTLGDALRASTDPRFRALALQLDSSSASASGDVDHEARRAEARTALPALAAAHPDSVLVQWIAATSADDSVALANLEHLEPDNAAVWALQLGITADDRSATAASLKRMATSSRADFHYSELLSAWVEAVRANPPPAKYFGVMPVDPGNPVSERQVAAMFAVTFSMSAFGNVPVSLSTACTDKGDPDAGLSATCAAAARLLLHSDDSLLMAMVGAAVLRRTGLVEAMDEERLRQVAWWRASTFDLGSNDSDAFLDDMLATGDEIAAMRRAAGRAGHAEPPPDWKAPNE